MSFNGRLLHSMRYELEAKTWQHEILYNNTHTNTNATSLMGGSINRRSSKRERERESNWCPHCGTSVFHVVEHSMKHNKVKGIKTVCMPTACAYTKAQIRLSRSFLSSTNSNAQINSNEQRL